MKLSVLFLALFASMHLDQSIADPWRDKLAVNGITINHIGRAFVFDDAFHQIIIVPLPIGKLNETIGVMEKFDCKSVFQSYNYTHNTYATVLLRKEIVAAEQDCEKMLVQSKQTVNQIKSSIDIVHSYQMKRRTRNRRQFGELAIGAVAGGLLYNYVGKLFGGSSEDVHKHFEELEAQMGSAINSNTKNSEKLLGLKKVVDSHNELFTKSLTTLAEMLSKHENTLSTLKSEIVKATTDHHNSDKANALLGVFMAHNEHLIANKVIIADMLNTLKLAFLDIRSNRLPIDLIGPKEMVNILKGIKAVLPSEILYVGVS